MIKIRNSGNFDRNYKELTLRKPKLKIAVDQRVTLFSRKPHDLRLRNHALRRRMKGKWAFSITEDVRIVYVWQSKNTVRFLAIGKHHQVYKKP